MWSLEIGNLSSTLVESGIPVTVIRVGALSKLHGSTPKSFTFVLKSTMNTKKWYLKVNNHPRLDF